MHSFPRIKCNVAEGISCENILKKLWIYSRNTDSLDVFMMNFMNFMNFTLEMLCE